MPPPRLKRSNTAGAAPASLADGELAINQADGLVYYHTAAGGVSTVTSAQVPHKATHATGGSDALTPADIGALSQATADTLYVNVSGDAMTGNLTTTARIGVGTSSPSQLLHVRDTSASPYLQITSSNTATAGVLIGDTDSATVGRLQYNHTFDVMQMFAGGSEQFRVSSGGAQVAAAGSASTPCVSLLTDTNTGLLFPADDTLAVSTGGVERMRVSNTGVTVGGSAVVVTTDSRLSDARTPTSHVHSAADITSGTLSDSRLSANVPLLVGGVLPSGYLPGYVDDVLEYSALASFPATGESGKLYVDTTTRKIYRWSGSAYVEISPSPGSTDAVPEGATNLYHTTARASAAAPVQSVNTKTGAVSLTATDVGAASTSHAHGNITSAGAIGSTANLPIITTTGGVLAVGSFGATAGTFCQGNDSRLSDARTPSAHTHAASDIVSGTVATARLGTGTASSLTFLRGDGTWATPIDTGITQATADTLYVSQSGGSITGSLNVSSKVGIGTTSPSTGLHLYDTAAGAPFIQMTTSTTGTSGVRFGDTDSALQGRVQYNHTFDVLQFFASGAETARTTSFAGLYVYPTGTATVPTIACGGDTNTGLWFPAADTIAVSTGGVERMRVASDGAVTVGGNAVVVTTDSRLSDARTPTAHTHGNITNAGAIGTTANLPLITTTSGVVTTGSFGTTANTFCQGNDSRLSDARTPTAHASTHATGGSDAIAPSDIGAAPAASPTFTGVVTIPVGSASSPAVTFTGDTSTGICSPLASTVSIATGGVERVRVASDGSLIGYGKVGIGAAPASTVTQLHAFSVTTGTGTESGLYSQLNCSAATGSGSKTGVSSLMVATSSQAAAHTFVGMGPSFVSQSSSTLSQYRGVSVNCNMQSGTGTLTSFINYYANGASVGGGAVTTQYGFYVDAGMTSATTNIGFVSAIPAATGRWNLFLSGSAQNYMAGNLGIGSGKTVPATALDVAGVITVTASAGTAALDINGDTFRVRTARTPASATAAGNVGEVCWDSSYLYICIASNTWRRIAHSTW